ncbi:MAG: AAA family ATPase [Planctomycetia bacterium]|nr:AAA family ATPase [Planctomycetia bacterium]
MTSNPPPLPERPLELTRLRVRNFRRIEQLDVEFPEQVRVICFVGPNGSGKSSLLSILARTLFTLTKESAHDLTEGSDQPSGTNSWRRSLHTGEIKHSHDATLVLTDWGISEKPATHALVIKRSPAGDEPGELFPEELGKKHLWFEGNSVFLGKWIARPPSSDDPIAKSVFLIRPADRSEQPNYEEPPDLMVAPLLEEHWIGERPFPVRIRTWGVRLEQFLLQMFVEKHAHSEGGFAADALRIWSSIFKELIGEEFSFNIQPWPFTRVGPHRHPQMSALSAGELDVLVTAAVILTQAVGLAGKHREKSFVPRGFVFIDEVDAHLHPQWQQKVMPILTEAFPQITFVITTHSPFVLRSLKKETSRVIRLPDGEVFDTEFAAWQIDDILEAVFEVPAQWAPGIGKQLARLKELAPDPARTSEAMSLYLQLLSHDSAALQAECRRIAGLFGSREFMEAIAKQELLDRQPVGTGVSANGDARNENGE